MREDTSMRKYVLLATLALAVVTLFAVSAAPALACASYSPGYWMNHPDWSGGGIWVGGQWYCSADAVERMQTPARGDKSITAFFIVTAAALDVYSGWGDDRATAFAAANAWVALHPPGSNVAANSPEWKAIESTIMFIDSTFQ
jgi:hypothetical protein